ncbi:uncharacterized protein [Linepithema humile]|uniref:uncharacterized protein n=1 Tax=Linepithema humile TaxID=83485 RepID=UPI00351E271C
MTVTTVLINTFWTHYIIALPNNRCSPTVMTNKSCFWDLLFQSFFRRSTFSSQEKNILVSRNKASASKRNKTIELPPGNYKNRWGNATPKQLEGAPANPEYNKKQDLICDKTSSVNKDKPIISDVPSSLKDHLFSLQVFHEENESEEMEINDDIADCYREIGSNEENSNYNIEIDNDDKEAEDETIDAEVNLPIVTVNMNEEIHASLNSLSEKLNILYEGFEQLRKEIKQEAAKNSSKLSAILAILRDKFPANEGIDEVTMDLMPQFPLTSIEQYLEFNETLKNNEAFRKCFDKRIKCIGGDSIQKMVSNILTNCISFDLGHKLSWTGAKNTIAIENSTFANIIVAAVSFTKGKGPDCTVTSIVKHIKSWLRHAGDKMRYRMKKQQ